MTPLVIRTWNQMETVESSAEYRVSQSVKYSTRVTFISPLPACSLCSLQDLSGHKKTVFCAIKTIIDFKSFCTREEKPKIFNDDWIHRNSQADFFIDVCTFSIVAATSEQTSILNSPCRRLRIDPFLCRLDLLPSTNLANVCLSDERKRLCVLRREGKKAHQHWRQCFFLSMVQHPNWIF